MQDYCARVRQNLEHRNDLDPYSEYSAPRVPPTEPAAYFLTEALMNRCALIVALTVTVGAAASIAQQLGPPPDPGDRDGLRGADRPLVGLPHSPQILTDSGGQPFRIVPITGLNRPWALAFLPNGDMLVTEIEGRLRIIRKGVLDPQPIAGLPEINTRVWRAGLMDVVVHPRHSDNRFIYFVYSKTAPPNPDDSAGKQPVAVTITLARARFDGGNALTDVKDLFVTNTRCVGACGSRIVFGRDGTIIMAVG